MRRRSVRTQPRPRRACSALPTASRDDPVHPASSSWESGSVILTPSRDGLAVALGELHEPRGDAPERVVRAELDALAVGIAQPAGRASPAAGSRRAGARRGTPGTRAPPRRPPRPARAHPRWPTARSPSMADSSPRRSPGPRNASTTSLPSAVTVETFTRPDEHDDDLVGSAALVEHGGTTPIAPAPAPPQQVGALRLVERGKEARRGRPGCGR